MALTNLLIDYISDSKFLCQLGVTLSVFTLLRVYLFYRTRLKRYQLLKYYGIPGPEPDLIGGSLSLARKDAAYHKMDEYCLKTFGKTYGFYIGDEPIIITTDLEILRKIFLEGMQSFKERTRTFLNTPMSKSVLFAPHHRWKVMRKVMSPFFSSYHMNNQESVQFLEESIKLMLDYIEGKVQAVDPYKSKQNCWVRLDIQDLMKATALHIISAMAIKLPSVQIKENEDNVRSLDSFLSVSDKGIVDYAIKFPFIARFLDFLAKHFEYNKTTALIHRGLDKTINEKLRALESKKKGLLGDNNTTDQVQLIDMLIKLHHEGKLTREEVVANADAVLFAGYDTTSTTLTYAFWTLGKHENIQETLRDDLKTYGVESQYLDQVLNETMRMYPVVVTFTSRLATETVTIDSLTVPQGAKVVYNTWIMHRHEELWPEPGKFDPERFKPGIDMHPCAFAPFGLGDRKCLGYQLAKMEAKMIICDILLRYKIKTIAPDELDLVSYACVISKPRDRVVIEIERL